MFYQLYNTCMFFVDLDAQSLVTTTTSSNVMIKLSVNKWLKTDNKMSQESGVL